jgi:large subunit ribosomal protein L15
MFSLNQLSPVTKSRKRIGRGGSRGGTSGKGHKGQRARSGGRSELRPFFEGGQMPLCRRLPRRGFSNPFGHDRCIVQITDLAKKFDDGQTVDRESLKACGLVKTVRGKYIKVLGKGSLDKKLVVKVDAVSAAAREAITSAGGEIVQEGE